MDGYTLHVHAFYLQNNLLDLFSGEMKLTTLSTLAFIEQSSISASDLFCHFLLKHTCSALLIHLTNANSGLGIMHYM